MQENQELPQGWLYSTLGETFNIVGGGTPSTENQSFWEGSIPWISSADIHPEYFKATPRRWITPEAVTASATNVVSANTLIVVTRVGLGKVCLAETDLCFSQDSQGLNSKIQNIDTKYALYFLTKAAREFKSKSRGTTISGITKKQLQEVIFPIPPLPEQRRIVAKLEELFSRWEAGVAALRQTQAQIKRYRQAVLHAAVTGELTRAWREAHPAPTESGTALLTRIRQERRAQWEAEQLAKRGGQLPLSDTWKKKFGELTGTDTSELPATWTWARLDQISEATGGFAFSSQSFVDTGDYQVIKIANVKPGKLTLDNRAAFINGDSLKGEVASRYLLRKDDCVITLTGTREKRDYGFVCRVREEQNLLLNQRLAFIRFALQLFAPYFEYALMSKHFQDNFFKYETGNVGQGNVGMRALTDETIMLPPLAEQVEIVAEVERRLSVLDELEHTLRAELTRAERLRQSILHRAFTGRLVPQDPTDEPAAALLARLQAEVPAGAATKAKRGRKAGTQLDMTF